MKIGENSGTTALRMKEIIYSQSRCLETKYTGLDVLRNEYPDDSNLWKIYAILDASDAALRKETVTDFNWKY